MTERVENKTKPRVLGSGASEDSGFVQAPAFQFGSSCMQSCGISSSPLQSSSLFSNFVQNSHDRFSHLLEERGFAHIPPPAGFGTPTRPASLLKDIWLNDANRVDSSSKLASCNVLSPNKKSNFDKCFKGTWNSDLPVSPLSPPSPFQHPFIKRQMGLTSDPWARFSGFGIPRLTPLIQQQSRLQDYNWRLQQTRDLHQRKSDSNILQTGRIIKIRHSGSADEIDTYNEGQKADAADDGDEVLIVEHCLTNNGDCDDVRRNGVCGSRKDQQYRVTSACRTTSSRYTSKNQSYK